MRTLPQIRFRVTTTHKFVAKLSDNPFYAFRLVQSARIVLQQPKGHDGATQQSMYNSRKSVRDCDNSRRTEIEESLC